MSDHPQSAEERIAQVDAMFAKQAQALLEKLNEMSDFRPLYTLETIEAALTHLVLNDDNWEDIIGSEHLPPSLILHLQILRQAAQARRNRSN